MSDRRVHLNKSAPLAYQTLSAFADAAADIAKQSGITPRLRELILLHCSQLNGCAYCVRVHTGRAEQAGITYDELAQLPVWRESGVFDERESAVIELAEAFTFIHRGGVSDEVYARVTSVLTDAEYVGASWLAIEINAFNRSVLASRIPAKAL